MEIAKNTKRKYTNHEIPMMGIEAVVSELRKRGLESEITGGHRKYVIATTPDNSRTVQILVKTKMGETNWHSSIRDARTADELPNDNGHFWIFVNLRNLEKPPQFWIVPDGWMRNDIYLRHGEYLARNNGERKRTKDSEHHSIEQERVTQWEGRWEVLGIFQ